MRHLKFLFIFTVINISIYSKEAFIKKYIKEESSIYFDTERGFLVANLPAGEPVFILGEIGDLYYSIQFRETGKGVVLKSQLIDYYMQKIIAKFKAKSSLKIFLTAAIDEHISETEVDELFDIIEIVDLGVEDKKLFKTLEGVYILADDKTKYIVIELL